MIATVRMRKSLSHCWRSVDTTQAKLLQRWGRKRWNSNVWSRDGHFRL